MSAPSRRPSVVAAAALASLACLSPVAQAAPMGFKDSWMVMAENSSTWQDISANYALTPRWALGGASTYMRSDDRTLSRTLTTADSGIMASLLPRT